MDARADEQHRSPSARGERRFGRGLFACVMLLAAAALWRSPWSASELGVVPDSMEYAIGAQRLATLGTYDISVEGVAYPPRYPPWFSLLLAPAYAIAPRELGAGIVPVLLLALSAVAAAWALGRRLAGDWGAAGAATALVLFPEFRHDAMKIMTDVPAVGFALWACVLYLRLRADAGERSTWALAGGACAAAFALRPECAALCVPFLALAARTGRRAIACAAWIVAPLAAVALATGLYDRAVFGAWSRTGYHFWLPQLHASLASVISTDNLGGNLAKLGTRWSAAAIVCGALGAWRLLRLGNASARGVVAFLLLGAAPISAFHLVYFYADLRFHLPALALLCVLAAAGAATLLPETLRRRARFALPLLALGLIAALVEPAREPARRLVAEALARETPPDAVIVTAIEPVYLEPLVLRGTQRRTVPLLRSIEYVAREVRLDWLERPVPESPRTGPVCAFVAVEEPQRIVAWVRAGVPVFLDTSFMPKDFPLAQMLGDELVLAPGPDSPWLQRFAARR